MSYGEYCKQYITEPIGAHSSRQSSQRNHDYQHTFIVGMPPESIGPEGAGGIGTTMADLCKFGQLFLTENEVVSEQSKQEIDKPWWASPSARDRLFPELRPWLGLGGHAA